MERVEINLTTGERKVITLTPDEETAALLSQAVWDADNTQDKRAQRAIDGLDLLQFEHLFLLENDKRDIKTKINVLLPGTYSAADTAQITRAQYRQALINRWKTLYA
jgi:hypothetical protein